MSAALFATKNDITTALGFSIQMKKILIGDKEIYAM